MFLLRSLKNLFNKSASKTLSAYKNIRHPYSTRLDEQNARFLSSDLFSDRQSILDALNASLDELGLFPYTEDCGMYSEHLLLFTSISLTTKYRPQKILEVGTYDGKTSCILSKLFPHSSITTVDLDDSDPIFRNSYGRDNETDLLDFINFRNDLLSNVSNVSFVQMNSLHLTNLDDSFDLIWIDGAHGYPTACCDITNSIRLLSKDGILMCDDVWKTTSKNDDMYTSIASWQTLQAYEQCNIIKNQFFRKRLGFKHLANEKFVSFSTLI